MNDAMPILIIGSILLFIFVVILIWSLCSIIAISQNISLLRELEYKKYRESKSGPREPTEVDGPH